MTHLSLFNNKTKLRLFHNKNGHIFPQFMFFNSTAINLHFSKDKIPHRTFD